MLRYRLQRSIRRAGLLLGIGLATTAMAPVRANSLMFIANVRPPALVATANAASQCVYISYDKNGNRLAQAVAPMAATTTIWGAATYGCFVWKQ